MTDTEDEPGRECPRFLALEAPHVLTAWSYYTRGLLPAAGGWEAQTEWWLEVLETIAAVIEEQRKKSGPSPLAGEGEGEGSTWH